MVQRSDRDNKLTSPAPCFLHHNRHKFVEIVETPTTEGHVFDLSSEQMFELLDDICAKDSLGQYNRFARLCCRYGQWGRSWQPKRYKNPLAYLQTPKGADAESDHKLPPLADDVGLFFDAQVSALKSRADLQLPYEAFYLTYMANYQERPKCLRRLVRHLKTLQKDTSFKGIEAVCDLFRENLRLRMLLALGNS